MKISEAIEQLKLLRVAHGDLEIEADCGFCGKSTHINVVVIAPATVKLQPR